MRCLSNPNLSGIQSEYIRNKATPAPSKPEVQRT